MVKTWRDVEEASLTDPFFRHAVHLVEHGLLTREAAMIQVAFGLAEARTKLIEEAINLHNRFIPDRVVLPLDLLLDSPFARAKADDIERRKADMERNK